MNKKVISAILVIVLVAGLAAFFLTKRDDTNDAPAQDTSVSLQSESLPTQDSTQKSTVPEEQQQTPPATTTPPPTTAPTPAPTQSTNRYITVDQYTSSKSEYTDNKKILFFHASWCSVCQAIDKEINAEPSRIPSGTTFIKTDYDDNTDLRKKYGVTYQYTFVQIDNEGNQLKKWSATTLEKALNSVQ